MTSRDFQDMTMTDCQLIISDASYDLRYTLNRFISPTPGDEKSLNDVIQVCDDIIDMCALIIEKAQAFDDVRSGLPARGML